MWNIFGNKFLRFNKPDFRQNRGDEVLLIWRDLPYWTIIDSELEELLQKFDGVISLKSILNDYVAPGDRGSVKSIVRNFEKRGVLSVNDRVVKKHVQDYKLENISINITGRCNLRCKFCYNLDRLENGCEAELSLVDIIKFLDDTKPFWSKDINLAILGGEPTVAEDKTIGLLDYAAVNKVRTIISTNGINISDEFAERCAGPLVEVQVSIDGATEQTHDKVRGKGSYNKSMMGIKKLVKAGVKTTLSMVSHQGNINELEKFYTLGDSLGVNQVRFIPLKKLGGAVDSEFKPVSIVELVKEGMRIRKAHPEFKKIISNDALSIMAESCKLAACKKSCGTGLQTFLLDANGDIYPCLNTNRDELLVANIKNPDFNFKNTWNESNVLKEVRNLTDVTNSGNKCNSCAVRHWCLGNCHGETYNVTGEFKNRAPNCAEQFKAYTEIMWMLAENPELMGK